MVINFWESNDKAMANNGITDDASIVGACGPNVRIQLFMKAGRMDMGRRNKSK